MKRVVYWITADYFIDVDMLLVPHLREVYSDVEIKWFVIRSLNSNIVVEDKSDYKVIQLHHRSKSLGLIHELYGVIHEWSKNKIDLIYSDMVGAPFYYPILFNTIGNNVPIIHAAHNVIPYPVWPLWLVLYVKYVLSRGQHFQVFSKFTGMYLQEHYRNKDVFYCPMTLKGYGEIRTNNYQIDANKVNLLFFGNVLANKCLDLLIDAVKGLPAQVKDRIHLTIAGNCKSPQSYIDQINNDPSITYYFQRVPDDDIPELFTKHDFLVLPYKDVAQSGPHMIAYYYNLPVIASDIEGFQEKVLDGINGFLFKSENIESLKEALTKVVMLDTKKFADIKRNLADYSSHNFSLNVVGEAYMNYFNKIFNDK